MIRWIAGLILAKMFGDGFAADLAGRGTAFLGSEVRKSISKDEHRLTKVQLGPGESYTVIARPPATRRERNLFARQKSLLTKYNKLSAPSKSQRKSARKLRKAQRRLDRVKPGSRRFETRQKAESERALLFDREMRPSRKLVKAAKELDETTHELDELRAARLSDAAAGRGRRKQRVKIYS